MQDEVDTEAGRISVAGSGPSQPSYDATPQSSKINLVLEHSVILTERAPQAQHIEDVCSEQGSFVRGIERGRERGRQRGRERGSEKRSVRYGERKGSGLSSKSVRSMRTRSSRTRVQVGADAQANPTILDHRSEHHGHVV